jgi:CubicO group peptidase (beta-lactamase class C family)
MTGHLSVPALEPSSGVAASLSPKVVAGILKNEWGFNGLIFTDALEMRGAVSGQGNASVQALLAGNDVLLCPANLATDYAAVKRAVESGVISMSIIEEACRKILQYKYITGLNQYKPIETNGLQQRIHTEYTDWLIQKLNNEAITLLKNNNNLIPIRELDRDKIAVLSIGASGEPELWKRLSLYAPFDFFRLTSNAAAGEVERIFRQLRGYSRIIVSIHAERMTDLASLQSLAREKEVHLCFFTSPYNLRRYTQSITNAKSVTLAYENSPEAQNAAAEILMGGIAAKGKLPVTISGLFTYGAGLATTKVRLSYQKPQEVKLDSNILKGIESIVETGIRNRAFPGCQVLVAKDGVIVYKQSFGYFDYAQTHSVQNSDVYDLASLTKAAATVPAIMKLVDLKQIALTDRVSRFVSELRNTNKQDITIRSALLHETGLPASIPFYRLLIDQNSYSGALSSNRRTLTFRTLYDTNVYMRTDFKFDSTKVSRASRRGISVQAAENFYVKDDFQQEVLNGIAGATMGRRRYLYSDLNFVLLQKVVENIAEQSLDEYLETNFYSRLGAFSTSFLPLRRIDKYVIAPTEHDEFLRNQILIGYPHDETAAVLGGVSGNAGLFSNANDLAKVLQMLLNFGEYGGEQYLSQETVQTFIRTKSTISRRVLGFDKPNPSLPSSNPTGALASASTYGHTGFTGTCFWIDPDNQLIYIFLSNRVYPSRTYRQLMSMRIRPQIQDVIYEAMQ